MEESNKLGALSSLIASYGNDSEDEDVEAEEDEVAAEVSSRQLASEILDGLVTKAFQGSRPGAFTAVQEPASSSDDDSGSDDDDDSGNEVS